MRDYNKISVEAQFFSEILRMFTLRRIKPFLRYFLKNQTACHLKKNTWSDFGKRDTMQGKIH